jgi:hypothetical protein
LVLDKRLTQSDLQAMETVCALHGITRAAPACEMAAHCTRVPALTAGLCMVVGWRIWFMQRQEQEPLLMVCSKLNFIAASFLADAQARLRTREV